MKELEDKKGGLTVLQLSDPLWNTSDAEIVPVPDAERVTVTFLQMSAGGVASRTMTEAEH